MGADFRVVEPPDGLFALVLLQADLRQRERPCRQRIGDLLAGVDALPQPFDPVGQHLPGIGYHLGHFGRGGLLLFGESGDFEICPPQRLAGEQFGVAATG